MNVGENRLEHLVASQMAAYLTLREFAKLNLKQSSAVVEVKRSFLDKYDEYIGGYEEAFKSSTFYFDCHVFWGGGHFKLGTRYKHNKPHILIPSPSQAKHPCPEMLDVPCIRVKTNI